MTDSPSVPVRHAHVPAPLARGGVGTDRVEVLEGEGVLEGHIRFRTGNQEHELHSGELLFFGPGDAHDIRATEQSALLITLSALGDDFLPDESASGGLSGL